MYTPVYYILIRRTSVTLFMKFTEDNNIAGPIASNYVGYCMAYRRITTVVEF